MLTSRKLHYSIALACAMLLLSACATVETPDLSVVLPDAWRNPTPAAKSGQTAPPQWWQSFADPQLDALVTEALAANLDVAAANQRLRAARALYLHRRAPYLPSLNFRTSDPIDPDASAAFFVAGFDASWELPLFGRRNAADNVARGALYASEAELRAARLRLTAEVTRQWILLREAQTRRQLQTRIIENRKRQLALVSRRVKLGLEAPEAALRSRAVLAQARAALAQPTAAATIAAQTLALLLARSAPDASWLRPGAVPALNAAPVTSTPSDLLRARPDVALSAAAVLQAAGELGHAHADRWPSIGIHGVLFASAQVVSHRPTEPNVIGVVGPTIDIPLFDWGLRKAREQASSYRLQAAALDYRRTVLAAVAEAEGALATLEQQRHADRESAQALAALTEVTKQTATRQRLGLASDLDLLLASVNEAEAGLAAASASSDHDLAYVALLKALGQTPIAADSAPVEAGTAALQ